MLEHANDAKTFVAGMDQQAFVADRKTYFAVLIDRLPAIIAEVEGG